MSIVWYQNGCSSTARCMSAAVRTKGSSSITLGRLDTDPRRTFLPGLPHRVCRRAHRLHPRVLLARGTPGGRAVHRSEEHTSELQSLMRNSYAVFCFKKKTKPTYKIQPLHCT